MDHSQLLQALEQLDKASVPEQLRSRLSRAAKRVSLALESPSDAIARVLVTQPTEAISVRIAADLGLFAALGDRKATTDEMAKRTGAQPELMGRLLRSLSAFQAIEQLGPNEYVASPGFVLLQGPKFAEAFGRCQDILNTSRQALPQYLQANGYCAPTDPTDTAFQFATGTKGKLYMETLMSDPKMSSSLQSFVVLMSVWAEGFNKIQDLYPVEERLQKGFDPSTIMFVDVGGGLGQKSMSLKKAIPTLPGRFIVQDRPVVIANASQSESASLGIELTAHDFMTDQPIKGARCYYIRQCLHNWPDQVCVVILEQLRNAARPGYSRILIQETIVPAQGADDWIVSQDFSMMTMFATGERTEADWRALCEKAGLSVSEVYLNGHPSHEGIVEINV